LHFIHQATHTLIANGEPRFLSQGIAEAEEESLFNGIKEPVMFDIRARYVRHKSLFIGKTSMRVSRLVRHPLAEKHSD
jgi:hypothetical protein